MADFTPLLALDLTDLRNALNRLDLMGGLIATFACDGDLTDVDRTTRRFYYRGARYRDDLGGVNFVPDGFIVCPDSAVSYVQWTAAGGVVQEASLDPLKFAIAEVTCASGSLTHIEDLRDMNLVSGGVRLLDDLEDVDIYEPTDGDILKYDLALGLWVNVPDTGGAPDVEDEGVLEESAVSRINFTGAGVTATGDGVGGVDVDVPGTDPLDPSLGLPANLHRLAVVTPIMESATITSFGRILTPTAVGSPGFSSETSGSSFQAGFHRPTRETTTAADQSAGWLAASANKVCWRGDAAGRGGFTVVMRFSFDVLPASTRAFIGLYGTAADPTLTAEPSAKADLVGVGWDSSDSNLQFIHNDGSGTATKVSLGVAPAVAVVYELVLIQPPNGGNCIARLYSITGDGATLIQGSTLTTNLPTTTVFLAPCQNINTAAGGSALTMCFHGWTLDTL